MNLLQVMQKAAQTIADKPVITTVAVLTVVTTGIFWNGVTYTADDVSTPEDDICVELRQELEKTQSLGEKSEIIKGLQKIGCDSFSYEDSKPVKGRVVIDREIEQ